jgi:hypothetical protein
MGITLHITADSAGDLKNTLAQLTGIFQERGVVQVSGVVHQLHEPAATAIIRPMDLGDQYGESAEDEVQEPEGIPAEPEPVKKRGRPKGSKNAAPKEEAPAEAPAPADPSKVRLAAVDKLRVVYARDGGPEAIRTLQEKYGVSRLLEVPLDQADALMTDATTLEQEIAA